MTILGIDPGPEQSAWVLYDGARVTQHGINKNVDVLVDLATNIHRPTRVVIEQITSYGMPVGMEVFETVYWTGRFLQSVLDSPYAPLPERLPRQKVKLHICGNSRAKDSNIRQALIDRFGGKEQAIGRKASPGPLYGIKADCWQALALAITWHETQALEATA